MIRPSEAQIEFIKEILEHSIDELIINGKSARPDLWGSGEATNCSTRPLTRAPLRYGSPEFYVGVSECN